MFDENLIRPLETVVFIRDFRSIKKGSKAIYIKQTTDSGYKVALVALLDENTESFLKANGYNTIHQYIAHKRDHCIFGESQWYNPFSTCKPYYNDIVSKNQLDMAESEIKSTLKKLRENLDSIHEYKKLID